MALLLVCLKPVYSSEKSKEYSIENFSLPDYYEVKSKKQKPKEELELKGRYSLTFGNPYIGLLYHISNKISVEPRIASDLAEIGIYFIRGYYNFLNLVAPKNKLYFYLALEPGVLDFKSRYHGYKKGYMVGIYPGAAYHITEKIALNIDIGASYISLDNDTVTGVEWILNTGLSFYYN